MKTFLALAFALFATAASARDIDFSTVLTDQDGAQITDCADKDCAGKPPLTLGRLAMHVLTATFPDEQNLPGEEKMKRGQLALRLYGGGVIDLSAEDVALLKRLVAKAYGPLIVMRAWPLLDPVR